MKIVTLGPEGSFSSDVARKYNPKAKIVYANSISAVFHQLGEKGNMCAAIPIMNQTSGFVEETIINLMKYDFPVISAVRMKVSYGLVGWGKAEEASFLLAHPHAMKQCKDHLKEFCPQAKLIETQSNSASALQISIREDKETLALVPPSLSEKYNLPIIAEHMEDAKENITTFYIIGKEPKATTGKDQSSFLIFSDLVGAIEKQIRTHLKAKKIELIQLKDLLLQEGHTPLYFMEIKGHIDDRLLKEYIVELHEKFLLKSLGSYPQN